MRILAIHECTVPIGSAMRNAAISFGGMTASALAIVTDHRVDGHPVTGYAFDSIGRYGKSGLLRERFIPRLLAAPAASLQGADGLLDPAACWRAAMQDEKDGGHGERPGAIGLIDAAVWDALAKARGEALWRTLAAVHGVANAGPLFATYGSCGHFQPSGGEEGLQDELRAALDLGYRSVKIKVDGRDANADAARVETALAVLPSAAHLAIDANGRADADDTAWIRAMAGFRLAWLEEPVSALDYAALARFVQQYEPPVSTGENLFSLADTINLYRYGGLRPALDRIQVDMLLAYGMPEYRRILDAGAPFGWQRGAYWPHAGHLFAAHAVAGFGLGSHESAPDASRLYGAYWDGTRVENGQVRIPDLPGVGYEAKANLYAVLRALA